MSGYIQLKKEAYEANMLLPQYGLVLYTFGNVSAVDRDLSVFAIKPSGVPYEELSPDQMVVVDFDNEVVEGALNPSSDTSTHAVLYSSFDSIGGIVHTHSTYATAWAQSGTDIPCFGTTHADHIYGAVPCTDMMADEQIDGDYTAETGMQIVRRFDGLDPLAVPMALVAGHGPFTWGETAADAVYNSVVLEELATMALYTLTIKPDIQPLKQSLVDKHYLRKHGSDATYGQAT